MTDSEKLDLLLTKVSNMETEQKETRLIIENVTNKNIQIIAEGHLDLNRKLNKALENSNENEMLKIRINTLENEVRKLKERVS